MKTHDVDDIARLSKHVRLLRDNHFPFTVKLPRDVFFHNLHHDWLVQHMGLEGIRFAGAKTFDTTNITVRKGARWTLDCDSVSFAHADDATLFKLTWC